MKKICFFFALLIIGTQLFAQSTIGLQLYTFRNQFKQDVPGTLEKINAMGIRLIEGGGTYGLSMDAFKQLLAKNKLTTISVGADFKQLDTDVQAVVANAKAFGAKYVMCAWVPHTSNFTIEDADKAIEVFNRAGKVLKENGITFCYHAHGYEFGAYKNGTMFDYMASKMNPAYANFEMDVFWVKQPGQDPVALLKKYPGRFPLMHLKDRKPGTPDSQDGKAPDETNVVLGAGDVGIAAIMKEAKKQGVKYYFIEDESPLSMEQVPQSLKFLKGLK
ncbi:MAG TPA: sugar phosphate isomerase/epimerase [Chitinophagaceae bacterium]|nr:sugar phosphate isomerase/epimerase [Chitinophagaceae bacterium]